MLINNELKLKLVLECSDVVAHFLQFFKPYVSVSLMSVFNKPSARAGCDTRSMFKGGITDLNLEFPF